MATETPQFLTLAKRENIYLPVNGLNLFSKSNCCFPMVPKSTWRSGQIAYSSIFLLIWKILSVMASGAGPAKRNGQEEDVKGSNCKRRELQEYSKDLGWEYPARRGRPGNEGSRASPGKADLPLREMRQNRVL